MIPEIKEFSSILDLFKKFPDEQSCIDQLEVIRWGGNVVSPFNAESKVYKCAGNKYKCKESSKYFNVRTGTIFEDTKLPLRTWLLAIYVIASHKKGISSHQLARDLDITQKSAWFVLHRVRYAFDHENFVAAMGGTVEIDETYVGGKEKNKHKSKLTKNTQGRSTETKTPVLGMVERGGNVKAIKMDDATSFSILPKVYDGVIEGSVVMTDEYRAYNSLEGMYRHQRVNHGKGEYVNGGIHTNTMEGFWSLFKHGVIGIYHHVSKEHLQSYLDEFTYRYNTREMTESGRFNLLFINTIGRLTYQQLITHE